MVELQEMVVEGEEEVQPLAALEVKKEAEGVKEVIMEVEEAAEEQN